VNNWLDSSADDVGVNAAKKSSQNCDSISRRDRE
jgi:hypothetical protein